MDILKNMMKLAGVAAAMGLVGGSIYVMQNKDVKRQVGKKTIKAMNSAEDMIAKKMN